jgi:thioredoxin reductase/Pyruvate/2-oxoacid:ferredoxin oxidoreductase delta subunit
MIVEPVTLSLYGGALAFIWAIYLGVSRIREKRHAAIWSAAAEAGQTEPVSLHPVINLTSCLGCGACVRACPEGDVLGLIRGKAQLIDPTHCIGHGECAKACPTHSIDMVFGTARRGVDLPQVGSDFQSNVPGLYIAGELGGMGLIRNAVEQGTQAVEAIAKARPRAIPGQRDLVIVGAGPAGIAAALAAKAHGLDYQVIEQDDLGGAVFKYPRGKVVMTAPVKLPLVGKVKLRETSKEALLALWQEIDAEHHLAIRYRERVERIDAAEGGFVVNTVKGQERCGSVLLAIGRRGSPRRLGVPGEDLPKVVYQLIDAAQYRGCDVLVVGGGDSALEAAAMLAGEPGTRVTLSHRGDTLGRARQKNREAAQTLAQSGRLKLLLGSAVHSIAADAVMLRQRDTLSRLENDAVIVCAGGELPTEFLRKAGIAMETKYGTR